ncbi:MAG: hypothetical protein SCH98_15045 [Deferrisomatales bacterium]|nr:hypothetical protein [Deferrisomatales bacterium]
MSEVMGVAWFRDEPTYQRARKVFLDPENLPARFEDWQTLVERQRELIRESGTIALRADIDPETFVGWCASRGLFPDSEGRLAFVKHVELEYRKTGKGTVLE